MKAKIKWRTGTREESVPFMNDVAAGNYANAKADAACLGFRDGHPEATRVMFNAETGEAIRGKSGHPQICAPWLLGAAFTA